MKILVADDVALLHRVYRKGLELEGHEVTTVETISEAKEMIRNTCFDLGIIDFDFKEEENGMDLVSFARKCGKTFPIILNTTSPDLAESALTVHARNIELDPLFITFKMTISDLRKNIQEIFEQSGH